MLLSMVMGTVTGVLVYLTGTESTLDSTLLGFIGTAVALISLSALGVKGGIRYRDSNHYVIGFEPGGDDACDGDD